MRILGANGFTGKPTSLNAIPSNYVNDGDICLTRIGNEDAASYTPAIYYHEYFANDGNDEDPPYVVVPLSNIDTNLNYSEPVLAPGRWKLKNVFTPELIADIIKTNTIVPLASGAPINIGDDLTIGPDGITVDGQVVVNSDISEPPFVVNSDVMVENLNAEYIGGKQFSHFLRNENHDISIPNGCTELNVGLLNEMTDTPHYAVFVDICNVVDMNPSIYGHVITNKQPNYFTIRFSGVIDSPNYTLHYFLVGDSNIDTGPSPSGSPSGSPPPSEDEYPWYIVSTDTAAVVRAKYMVDTSSNPVTIVAPSNPIPDDAFFVSDYEGTFGTNNCTILRNGNNIEGYSEDLILDLNNKTVKLVFLNETHGWKVIW